MVHRRAQPRSVNANGGFSLVEIMVVIAIIVMMFGAATFGFRALTKSELRSSAAKLGAAVRYCFDRAITTGQYYRLVIDFDGNKYWAERSDERMYISRTKEKTLGSGRAFDRAAQEKALDEEEARERKELERAGGSGTPLEPPPKPKRAKFQTFQDATLPTVTLKRIHLKDAYTPRQPEAYSKGRAYLYFFPDGHTERAVVRLTDEGDNWYSIVVHPLTGRVEVKNGRYDIPRYFDEGQK